MEKKIKQKHITKKPTTHVQSRKRTHIIIERFEEEIMITIESPPQKCMCKNYKCEKCECKVLRR